MESLRSGTSNLFKDWIAGTRGEGLVSAPDSKARSTGNSADEDVRNALSKGDAVAAGHDPNVFEGHIGAPLHLNSICVGAVSRGMNFEVSGLEIHAIDDAKVDVLAINRYYAIHDCVWHIVELEVLQNTNMIISVL